MKKVTIYDLVQEMRSFTTRAKGLVDKSSKSTISTQNNVDFKRLVNDWKSGAYDEDPETVVFEMEQLLK